MKNNSIVYFSPHLDDALFSCAGTICKQTEAGMSVLIVTLFSGDGSSSPSGDQLDTSSNASKLTPHFQRISEDIDAIEECGANYLHLGFLDAPFRNPSYRQLHNIFGRAHPQDAATITSLREALDEVLKRYEAVAAYFPLGIGGHIDHRLTFLAAQSLEFAGQKYFYEDRPYVFAPRSCQRRLRQLGIDCRVTKKETFNPIEVFTLLRDLNRSGEFSISMLGLMKLIGRYLLGSREVECEFSTPMRPHLEEISSQTSERALRAISRYSTQIVALTCTMQRWVRCINRYAQRTGLGQSERFWAVPKTMDGSEEGGSQATVECPDTYR